MPILQVKISAHPTPELSRQVAATLVEITVRILHKRADLTSVAVDYVAPEHWIVGGQSLAEHGKASFFLDIKVVDGTNTKDEKAHYQQEVFARMGELLGDLHPESYIYVHDVRAEAYGFGGLTQEFRYIQAKLSV
ncbi:MAG: tautomerase family protein [Janthinobacterium lividum]